MQNSLLLSTYVLFHFLFEAFSVFWNASTIIIPFFSFKGTTQVYLVKISITHDQNLIPSLKLLINFHISKTSTPNIVFKWRINSSFLKIFNKRFIKLIGMMFIWHGFTCSTRRLFIKKLKNHRSNTSLISIIFWILCNTKCFKF